MNEINLAGPQAPLLRRVKGLMLGRVIVITFLWAALVSVEITGGSTPTSLPLRYVVVLTYFLTILYGLVLRWHPHLERFYLVQVSLDLLIETAILYSTGGLNSGFAFLYILSIISAGVALRREAILGVASAASLFYCLLAYLEFNGIIHPLPFPFAVRDTVVASGPYVFYSTLLMITAFLLVGTLSSYLAETLRRTGQVLKQQTQNLIGLRAFHENVVNSMNSGLLMTDMTGHVISFNKAAERILLLTPRELQGRPSQEVLPVLDIDDILHRVETLDYGLNRGEGLFERSDGRKITLGLSFSPLRDEKGTIHGIIINFQDITVIRAMETEIKRAEQLAAVGRLSAAIAHEIRNPLASISGSIQLLRSEFVLDETNQRLMDIVVREIERLNAVITDFLAYARPRPLEFVAVDVHKLITGTLALLEHGLPLGSVVTITSQLGVDVPAIMADPQGLRQVIWNLCLNAVEAMDHHGTLTVCTAVHTQSQRPTRAEAETPPPAPELIIDVTDTGPGIPPEVREKIFEPFYSTKRGGTGLGLATVDRIICNHLGRVKVDSEPGFGTTMRIHLPLLRAPTVA
ncbi:MAG: PAS domain S-box protein [Nitrospinae bacterium]|nr:PAS domain S-box protein [Nitrospinota bacterium]